jgi:hypothetical protein
VGQKDVFVAYNVCFFLSEIEHWFCTLYI